MQALLFRKMLTDVMVPKAMYTLGYIRNKARPKSCLPH